MSPEDPAKNQMYRDAIEFGGVKKRYEAEPHSRAALVLLLDLGVSRGATEAILKRFEAEDEAFAHGKEAWGQALQTIDRAMNKGAGAKPAQTAQAKGADGGW